MDIIYLEGAEAEAAHREMAAQRERLDAFLKRTGAKSAEAVVLSDPPVSDVDAD